jgi:hypothetical protein
MKIKTSELKDLALDWAVAIALNRGPKYNMESHGRTWRGWWLVGPGFEYEPMPSYSTDWQQGGPIIEREKIAAVYRAGRYWLAYTHENYQGRQADACGPTPLIAAMRCFVRSKLGDEVEIPEELT